MLPAISRGRRQQKDKKRILAKMNKSIVAPIKCIVQKIVFWFRTWDPKLFPNPFYSPSLDYLMRVGKQSVDGLSEFLSENMDKNKNES